MIAQVSAEVIKPLSDRPYEGFVNLTTEISPMASAVYEAGRSAVKLPRLGHEIRFDVRDRQR